MPELPDIEDYLVALRARVIDQALLDIQLFSPFLLRTVEPAVDDLIGQHVRELRRVGKRIAFGLDSEAWIVLHLMIAGRLAWHDKAPKSKSKNVLARFEFASGHLTLTEAGSKKRASLHLLPDHAALHALDPGGLEVLDASLDEFRQRLTLRNHTLKRALTDPRLFSGIGNAYSDEILHAARLSPIQQTQKLSAEVIECLFECTQQILTQWRARLRDQTGDGFPQKVTAFRDDMAVHGRYGQPCPVCGTEVQRIRYASNEVNYCPRCQTDGRLLADRALSRLLKKDWPRTIEALENQTRDDA